MFPKMSRGFLRPADHPKPVTEPASVVAAVNSKKIGFADLLYFTVRFFTPWPENFSTIP